MTPSINAADLLSSHADTLVADFEGDVPKTYKDQNGIDTCCFGHTGAAVLPGRTYTRAECIAFLRHDLLTADNDILRLVRVPLNQNEYDALVSFDYNIGCGHLASSDTLHFLNQGNRIAAANAMLAWDKIGGHDNPGLLRRRTAERKLFLTPVSHYD